MSNQNSQQKIPDVENQYRVAALARVNQMHDDLINANAVINQLRVDLNREHDRVTLTLEERDRYRHEAVRFRKLLIELATQMANIGLLTRKAEECVSIVGEMDAAPTPAAQTIDRLEEEHGKRARAKALAQLGVALEQKEETP